MLESQFALVGTLANPNAAEGPDNKVRSPFSPSPLLPSPTHPHSHPLSLSLSLSPTTTTAHAAAQGLAQRVQAVRDGTPLRRLHARVDRPQAPPGPHLGPVRPRRHAQRHADGRDCPQHQDGSAHLCRRQQPHQARHARGMVRRAPRQKTRPQTADRLPSLAPATICATTRRTTTRPTTSSRPSSPSWPRRARPRSRSSARAASRRSTTLAARASLSTTRTSSSSTRTGIACRRFSRPSRLAAHSLHLLSLSTYARLVYAPPASPSDNPAITTKRRMIRAQFRLGQTASSMENVVAGIQVLLQLADVADATPLLPAERTKAVKVRVPLPLLLLPLLTCSSASCRPAPPLPPRPRRRSSPRYAAPRPSSPRPSLTPISAGPRRSRARARAGSQAEAPRPAARSVHSGQH